MMVKKCVFIFNEYIFDFGIKDTWLWIQRTTAVLGLITFYGVLFYKKIDVMEKQIKYLTEYKDKLSLKNVSTLYLFLKRTENIRIKPLFGQKMPAN